MKLLKLGAFTGLALAKTDVHFNHDHKDGPEIAQLEKWNALAQKFFRMHQEELSSRFYRKWAVKPFVTPHGKFIGRFEKEIGKLERNFIRCTKAESMNGGLVAQKHHDKRKVPRQGQSYTNDPDVDENDVVNNSTDVFDDNSNHRMRHIVHNVKKWTEENLKGCRNQEIAINRWQKFIGFWELEIRENPIFQEVSKNEERYLRNNDGPGRPCGKIYREFGLNGYHMEVRDGSYDPNNHFNNLKDTQFGNDQLMSMIPYEGKS